jgi:hypothetical protein
MCCLVPEAAAVPEVVAAWLLQVLRGPLYQLLVGLENGEFTELVNAFVSRHAMAVRSMGVGSECEKAAQSLWR